jgi:RNA polymerase sigma-70 factor (ECF subfamily)
MHEETDDQLALRSREGDPRALALLYRRHAPALLAYLERILPDRADAEDVLHETFLRLFQGRGRYREQNRFRGWLFTVATRLAWDRLNSERRRGDLLRASPEAVKPSAASDPAREAERHEVLRRLGSTLADLPPSYAMAFHLRLREEFTYPEMAAITGEPEGTLRSRVHHALKRIRRTLESIPGARETEENGP